MGISTCDLSKSKRKIHKSKAMTFDKRDLLVAVILLIIGSSDAFEVVDCRFDEETRHVEYICEGATSVRFHQDTYHTFYCHNYPLEIDFEQILILSLENCHDEALETGDLIALNDLRILNISYVGIRYILSENFQANENLEQIIAAHNQLSNIPSNLFSFTNALTDIDFSHNQILKIQAFTFDNIPKLRTLTFSSNLIATLEPNLFINLPELEIVDFSNNQLKSIDNILFAYNGNLRTLNFNDNNIKHLDCKLLSSLNEMHSVQILLNTLENMKTNCPSIDRIDITVFPSNLTTKLKLSNRRFNWIFSKNDFSKLKRLNFSNSQLSNLPMLLNELGPELQALDLSHIFFDKLNRNTFQRFSNLKELYLSQTNLSDFRYSTFYNQRNLRLLDLSYNNLNRIDFYMFVRNFQHLIVLNLEGNNFTDIDTVTRTHFPNLSVLAIAQNHFSCNYLVKFLIEWTDLKLIEASTQQMHVGGVDCIHDNLTIPSHNETNSQFIENNSTVAEIKTIHFVLHENLTANENTSKLNNHSVNTYLNNINRWPNMNVDDIYVIEILLCATVFILFVFLLICMCFICGKCQRVMTIYQRRMRNDSSEPIVIRCKQDKISEFKSIHLKNLDLCESI